jgi:hypothetical protein
LRKRVESVFNAPVAARGARGTGLSNQCRSNFMAKESRTNLDANAARVVYEQHRVLPGVTADMMAQPDGLWTVTWTAPDPAPAPMPAVASAPAKLTPADFQAAASALGPGVPVAIVRAFAEVESGGKSGFDAKGRPVIAYEGHWFRKLTDRKFDAAHPLLSYPYVKKAGPEWQTNNKNPDAAWQTLQSAMALDHGAAVQSCSWGMFQVMGFNFASCGYANVDAFVAAMSASERGQLDAFVGFCRSLKDMVKAMAAKDFKAMATKYNGEDYGDYDTRIANAYKKYGGT